MPEDPARRPPPCRVSRPRLRLAGPRRRRSTERATCSLRPRSPRHTPRRFRSRSHATDQGVRCSPDRPPGAALCQRLRPRTPGWESKVPAHDPSHTPPCESRSRRRRRHVVEVTAPRVRRTPGSRRTGRPCRGGEHPHESVPRRCRPDDRGPVRAARTLPNGTR
jgi:hypothetical protein